MSNPKKSKINWPPIFYNKKNKKEDVVVEVPQVVDEPVVEEPVVDSSQVVEELSDMISDDDEIPFEEESIWNIKTNDRSMCLVDDLFEYTVTQVPMDKISRSMNELYLNITGMKIKDAHNTHIVDTGLKKFLFGTIEDESKDLEYLQSLKEFYLISSIFVDHRHNFDFQRICKSAGAATGKSLSLAEAAINEIGRKNYPGVLVNPEYTSVFLKEFLHEKMYDNNISDSAKGSLIKTVYPFIDKLLFNAIEWAPQLLSPGEIYESRKPELTKKDFSREKVDELFEKIEEVLKGKYYSYTDHLKDVDVNGEWEKFDNEDNSYYTSSIDVLVSGDYTIESSNDASFIEIDGEKIHPGSIKRLEVGRKYDVKFVYPELVDDDEFIPFKFKLDDYSHTDLSNFSKDFIKEVHIRYGEREVESKHTYSYVEIIDDALVSIHNDTYSSLNDVIRDALVDTNDSFNELKAAEQEYQDKRSKTNDIWYHKRCPKWINKIFTKGTTLANLKAQTKKSDFDTDFGAYKVVKHKGSDGVSVYSFAKVDRASNDYHFLMKNEAMDEIKTVSEGATEKTLKTFFDKNPAWKNFFGDVNFLEEDMEYHNNCANKVLGFGLANFGVVGESNSIEQVFKPKNYGRMDRGLVISDEPLLSMDGSDSFELIYADSSDVVRSLVDKKYIPKK